jgi:large subunit ribosomal protein L29
MPRTKASDLRELAVEQLEAKLAEARQERSRLHFRRATEAIDNPMRLRSVRRDIAKLLTVLREKGNA